MTICVGLLGLAHYHAEYWIDAWMRHPRAAVMGVWDADAVRSAGFAGRHGTRAFPDAGSLLAECDAVGILSETADHATLVEAACAAGRAVLCEKPVADSLAGLARIEAAVRHSGIVFAQSFPKRTDPVNQAVRDVLASGELGRVFLARVRHGHGHARDPAFLAGWWTDPARSGGGTLLDEGIHAADLLRWLFGEPAEAIAMLAGSPDHAVDDVAIAGFRWPGGLLAEVATGWHFASAEASVELYGTAGTLLLSGVDLASRAAPAPHLRVSLLAEGGAWRALPAETAFPTGDFHQRSAGAFVDCLVDGTPPPAGLDDSAGALRMVLAAYRAAREGRVTKVR